MIEIRGTQYPDTRSAAKAVGVTPKRIRDARTKGTLDRVGCGRPGPAPLPVRIAGVTYDSAEAASKALGINRMRIYAAVADGDPDRVVRPPRYNPARSIPFRIGTLSWPSMGAASRALGFESEEFIAQAVKRRSKRGWQRILAAAMHLEAQQLRASLRSRSGGER